MTNYRIRKTTALIILLLVCATDLGAIQTHRAIRTEDTPRIGIDRPLATVVLGLTLGTASAGTATARTGEDEIALFNAQGDATAYIAVDDDLTIFLWSGKPVAYLHDDPAGGFHVYGFNGKHLGWLTQGIFWDHQGRVGCATKERMRQTSFEPFKAFKEFKPFKAFQEFAPFRPLLVQSWSDTGCGLLLARGSA
jgi:hypothetical protein